MTKNERLLEVNKLLNSKAFKTKDVAKVVARIKKIYPLYTQLSCIDGQLTKLLLSVVPKNCRAELRQSSISNYLNVVRGQQL